MISGRSRQRGFSLVEALVAIAVVVVAILIALLVYDAARKSMKKGENVSEQQQSVRIAFDKLNSDLRMAGFNYNPDGDVNRPDEQIEAAYDTAIAFRADLDAEDSALSATPETSLAGGAFLTVSTGNDEIVAYVLAKPDGSSSGSLTLNADVQEAQRNGTVETVTVPNVALVQNNPPYTLYRVTVLPNSTSTVRTPLVENVRSMTFRYYNQSGAQINSTFDLSATTDDIGGAESAAAKTNRAAVRRIAVDLVGLTRDPDLGWKDATDTNPVTQAYRKFQLTGDITPRNLGKKGLRDIMADLTPPSKPGAPTLVPGHCGGLYITWPANPISEEVASYRINYGTTSPPNTPRTVTGTSYYLPGLANATLHYVTIQAQDAAGNISVSSNQVSTTTSNTNTPQAPTGLAGTTGLSGVVNLTWTAVSQNTSSVPSGDPTAPSIRDLKGYRVYRGASSGFTADLWSRIVDETVVTALANPQYPDTSVVNCRSYFYKLSAVDACGTESAVTSSVAANGYTDLNPLPPANAQAFITGLNQNTISWQAVTKDEKNNSITIDRYRIYRSSVVPSSTDVTTLSYSQIGEVTAATSYPDNAAPSLAAGYTYYYVVTALDDCPHESAYSDPTAPTCVFLGTVAISSPANNASVAGVVPINVSVTGGGLESYKDLTLIFYNETLGTSTTRTDGSSGPTWSYNWLANPPGPYTITAIVTNSTGCPKVVSIHVAAGTDVGCCLSPPNPNLDPVTLTCTGTVKNSECKEVSYTMINNNCLTKVRIDQMTITWDDVTTKDAKLSDIKFTTSVAGTTTGIIGTFSPPEKSPAIKVFSTPQPSIGILSSSTNPLLVTYVYNQVMSLKLKGNFLRNSLTTEFKYTLLDSSDLPTSISGTCGPGASGGAIFDNLIVEQHD